MLVHQLEALDAQALEIRSILASLISSCIGCADCKGGCAELYEMVTVPESVLSRTSNA